MTTQLYLTPRDQGRALSLEEFESAEGGGGFRYELIHGRWHVSPLPGVPHDDLKDWLMDLLRRYARRHPDVLARVKGQARVFVPDQEEGTTAPEPDIAAYAEYPSDVPVEQRDWRDVSPILVVEVL